MVTIPYIKIPQIPIRGISSARNIYPAQESKCKISPPTPIIYLTQWKLMGNSEVHTDEYLTQWKVEGNSVVDNNAILSCGDYSDVDGKYHVKISNGVTIYDIPLTEPLRKVNDVADSIEFVNGVATLIRKCAYVDLSTLDWGGYSNNRFRAFFELPLRPDPNNVCQILNTGGYTSVAGSSISSSATQDKLIAYITLFHSETSHGLVIRDESFSNNQDAKQKLAGIYAVYELATPITETIQVSPFPISATDTYTSANDTPYSAFEYKKNVEIWSCGEYSATDGKYHILVQPLGGSIADIALDEPLRKVIDVADSIEFADGVTIVTRNIAKTIWNNLEVKNETIGANSYMRFYTSSLKNVIYVPSVWQERVLCCMSADFVQNAAPLNLSDSIDQCMCVNKYTESSAYIYIRDTSVNNVAEFKAKYGTHELLYRLATPTTETIQVPQIEEADSYSCVISQGGKAVSWSSFTPNPS